MEDNEIVALYMQRAESAIRETAQKYGGIGRRLAHNLLQSAEDAEEVLSDAYLGVRNSIPPERPDPFRAYFLRIVRNCATARYHKLHAEKRNSAYDLALDELAACLSDAGTVDDALAARELAATLNRFLAMQSAQNRILFVRRYWYGEPVHALAAAMHLPAARRGFRALAPDARTAQSLSFEGGDFAMKRRLISDALNQLDTAWIEEAAAVPAARRRPVLHRLLAAAAAFCLVFVAVAVFLPRGGITVTAYAACEDGTSTSLTSDSVRFATGQLQPNGELTGHPLLFHLAGESIQSVRFSCKNEKLRFTDLTEQRDEFGLAQNFTVPYGKDAAAYEFLLIDWVPERLIAALREGAYASFSALPDELRQDTIVIEIRDYRGRTAVKAITVAFCRTTAASPQLSTTIRSGARTVLSAVRIRSRFRAP